MYTTRETSQKLKDAGYPQDQPKNGFYCHDPFGGYQYSEMTKLQKHFASAIHAPDALELMQAINERCLLSHINGKWEVQCGHMIFYHENPAEALAEAYLHIHEKQQ